MELLTPRGTPSPPPETRAGRSAAIAEALSAYGIYPRRFSQAQGHGEIITYAHVVESDVPRATAIVANALGWPRTVVSNLPGCVAVTTSSA